MRALSLALVAVLLLAAAGAPAAGENYRIASIDSGGARPAPKTLTAKEILSIKIPQQVSAASSAGRFAWVVKEPDFATGVMKSTIWGSMSAGGAPVQLTGGDRKEHDPRWAEDGGHLAFLGEGGASRKTQVFVLSASGGEPVCITDAPEGVASFDWLDDGTIVYLAQEAVPESLRMRRERARQMKDDGRVHDADYPRREIWKVPIGGGKGERLFRGGPGLLEVEASPGGDGVVYTDNGTGRPDDEQKADLWVLDLAKGTTRKLVERKGAEYTPSWSPGGGRIAYLAHLETDKPYSRADLYVAPAGGGAPLNLTASLDRNIVFYAWSGDGASLLAVAEEGARHAVYRVDASGKGAEAVLGDRQYLYGFAVLGPDTLILAREEPAVAPEVCLYTMSTKTLRRVSDLSPWLKDYRLAQPETVRWTNPRDGMAIEGVLVKPLDYREGKRYPLIVRIHGGPYGTAADSMLYYYEYQALPPLGYMVLAPNYRGSSGWGNAFGTANYRDLGGMDYLDIISGVDYLVEKGLADPQRLGVAGLSYGGYMTNWIVGHTDRFKAAVSISGIFSLAGDFSNSSMPAWEKEYLGSYYWDDPKTFAALSPASYVKNIRTPVLILHGEDDNNTYISNSQELYQALFHLGRTVRFVRYPREGHELEEPNHVLDALSREMAWFDRYVLGREWRAALGEWAGGEDFAARVDGWASDPSPLERVRGEGPYVLVLRVRAKAGAAFHPSTEVVVVDGKDEETAPCGVVVGEGASRWLMKGDAEVSFDADREVTVRLLFSIGDGAGPLRLKVRDLPLMELQSSGRR